MSQALRYEEPGAATSAVLAFVVHAVLIAFLVIGVSWQSNRPDAVVVELWSRAPVVEEAAPSPPEVKPEPKVEPPPPKPEPKAEPKPQPKVEPKPVKPDIAVERQKKPPKKPPPKKAEPREEPPLKLDPAQRIREELAREEEALKQPRQSAQPARPAAPSAASAPDAGYIDRIRTKIKYNVVLPPDMRGNPEAIFDVVQLPTGEVIGVKLRKSSGLAAYDDAVERAIRKSSPLPRPDKPEQFRRELELKFRPQE